LTICPTPLRKRYGNGGNGIKKRGELTPSEAAELSKVIDSYARVLQSVEFEGFMRDVAKAE
jgi:hypothetical protein